MSGIATKKARGDTGVQLTYPAVFQEVYADEDLPMRYEPTLRRLPPEVLAGDDFFSQLHNQRRADADAMVMAKVQATNNMNMRALTGHAGYHLPAPVLSQRRFANPSNGAYFPYSARQDYRDAPFNYMGEDYMGEGKYVGGVLRTAQGQAFGKSKLLARIAQLNEIADEKMAFQLAQMPGASVSGISPASAGFPMRAPAPQFAAQPTLGAPEFADIAETSRFELKAILQNIRDSLTGGVGSTVEASNDFSASVRALALIIRIASTGTIDDLDGIYQFLADDEGIISQLQSLLDPDRNLAQNNPQLANIFSSMLDYWRKVMNYVEIMMRPDIFNRTLEERAAASRNALRTSGLSEIKRGALLVPRADRGADQREAQRAEDREALGNAPGGGPPGAGPPGGGFPPGRGFRRAPEADFFTTPAPRREDTERGMVIAAFDEDDRQEFGANAGVFFPGGGAAEMPEARAAAPAAAAEPPHRVPAAAALGPARRDAETGEYNVVVQAPPAVAPTVAPTPARALEESRLPDWVPKTREDIPSGRGARGALEALISRLNRERMPSGRTYLPSGTTIEYDDTTTTTNLRKNLIRRFGF
jgi:hypothetical protein